MAGAAIRRSTFKYPTYSSIQRQWHFACIPFVSVDINSSEWYQCTEYAVRTKRCELLMLMHVSTAFLLFVFFFFLHAIRWNIERRLDSSIWRSLNHQWTSKANTYDVRNYICSFNSFENMKLARCRREFYIRIFICSILQIRRPTHRLKVM